MKILNSKFDLDLFFRQLSSAPDNLLLLDYDGTLAPFTEKRMMAHPYPGIEKLISRIMNVQAGRVIIISGRTIEDLMKLLKFSSMPELWGCHGWERMLPGGEMISREPDHEVTLFLDKASEWACSNNLKTRVERKPVSVAFHWRGGESGLEDKMTEIISQGLSKQASDAGMEMKRFDGGIEFIVPGVNKGKAVKSILENHDENTAVAYLGDDNTDEDAFSALEERGLSILVGPELRPTRADIWIKPPEELFLFLEKWAETCGKVK
ncbi:MAG: trehalose-phosphatase [Candidatus Krumholzibacteriota bacterium]|nr:trehalose-phosphatase [Candidatus Krumholzibacteriota bacterium]